MQFLKIKHLSSYKKMKFWDQIAEYLFIKKREQKENDTKFTKYMHGMNRISIYMFLIVILLMLFKAFILPMIRK
ncbi:MAG: DUF6728 family protein [Bacteroidota bacterium]